MFSKSKHNEKGQVLIESIVAISIGVVGLLGFLHLLTQAIAINKDVGQQSVATYLAAEGIEVVKSIIDANFTANPRRAWNAFLSDPTYEVAYSDSGADISPLSSDPTPLEYHPLTGLYDYVADAVSVTTGFTRTVQISTLDTDGDGSSSEEMKVVSTVQWQKRGGGTNEVALEDHFFDWRLY